MDRPEVTGGGGDVLYQERIHLVDIIRGVLHELMAIVQCTLDKSKSWPG